MNEQIIKTKTVEPVDLQDIHNRLVRLEKVIQPLEEIVTSICWVKRNGLLIIIALIAINNGFGAVLSSITSKRFEMIKIDEILKVLHETGENSNEK